jgi:hypothetical protein
MQAKWLFANNAFVKDRCVLCNATLQIGKFISLAVPEQAFAYVVSLSE